MYKIASKNRQSAVDKIGWADIVSAGLPETLTPEQKYECLKNAVKSLEPMILASSGAERRSLGLAKFNLMQQMREIKIKPRRDLGDFLVKEAREYVGKAAWSIIFKRATEAYSKWVEENNADEEQP